jgi:acetyl esterase/lipase
MKKAMIGTRSATVRIWMAALILSSGATLLAEPQPELLWPNGPPDSNGLSGPEIRKGCIGNISIPTVTVFPPPKETSTGAAVVVIPGGGYGVVCVEPEGMPIVKELNERGITAVMLKYRLPNQRHSIPANDARRAIRMARARAEDWGIDPKRVGVWGFSAGGHLASTVATVFDSGNADSDDPVERMSSRPDFAILFYPVISMKDEIGHQGSRRNLIGKEDLVERYSNERQVTAQTPPCFLLHCTDDGTVNVENSVRFYQALVANKVPASCVLFEKGGHGPNAFNQNPSWEGVLDGWLQKRGCLK